MEVLLGGRGSRDAVLHPPEEECPALVESTSTGTWSWSTGCCGAYPTVAVTLPGLLTTFDQEAIPLRKKCCRCLEAVFA